MKKAIFTIFAIAIALGTGFSVSYFAVSGVRFALQKSGGVISSLVSSFSLRSLASTGEVIENIVQEKTEEAQGEIISAPVPMELVQEKPRETDSDKLAKITADSYLVADLESGDILLAKNSSAVRPIASISKLMTALVSFSRMDQADIATVSSRALDTRETAGGLVLNEKISVGDLLFPLLLESSNDAAEVIAEHFGRANFIAEMNTTAKSLGMKNTSFSDPSGLSNQNVSTAQDLFLFVRDLYLSRSEVFTITRQDRYQVLGHRWVNASLFVNEEGYLGGKSGYIYAAGHTLISLFNFKTSRGDRRIAFITLKGDNKEADMRLLIGHVINSLR